MFDQIPNAPLIEDTVNVGWQQTANAWNLQQQAGVQGSS